MRAVECAVRTMFFLPIACEADHHPWLIPAGNIGEKCSVGVFFFGAHGAPYRRWSRAAGVAAFLHADFATAWVARFAVRIVPQRFEERRVGPPLLPVGDGVWRAGGGRQGRVRAVVPAGQSLADSSAPFFTRFALRAALAFSLETGAPFGEGGRFHRATPGPILSRQADSR